MYENAVGVWMLAGLESRIRIEIQQPTHVVHNTNAIGCLV
jgi:hypothetical protein